MTNKHNPPKDVEDGDWYADARAAVRDATIDNKSDFAEFNVSERTNVINLSSTYPLSETRDIWQNVEDGSSEERLFLDEGTDETSFIRSSERARYIPGYESQVGIGVRIPNGEINDEEVVMRWGYFENGEDQFDKVGSAFYFGIDKNGVFVGENAFVDEFNPAKIYQENWNGDTLTGEGGADNPSGLELTLSDGVISQIEFIYYGYGPVRMQFWVYDSEMQSYQKVIAHTFTTAEQTSVEEVNLPLRAEIVADEVVSNDYEMYVGGRQFSVVGQYTPSTRLRSHTRTTSLSFDDSEWATAIAFRTKDDFQNITSRLVSAAAFTDDDARFMIRKGQNLINEGATFITPSDTKAGETAMEVTTDPADPTAGVKIAEGLLSGGQGNTQTATEGNVNVRIGDRDEVAFFIRNIQGSGSSKANVITWEEEW